MLVAQSVVCLLQASSDARLQNLGGCYIEQSLSSLWILFRVNFLNQEESILVKGLPSTSLIFNDVYPYIHIDLAAHSVDLITPAVFQFMLPNYLIIPNQYHIPLVQCYCQGFLVISSFFPQCLCLGHISSNFEGFS